MSRCSFQPCAQYMVTRNKSPTICSFLLLRHSVEQMPTTLTIKDFPFSNHLISNVMAYFPDKNSGIVIHSTLQLMVFFCPIHYLQFFPPPFSSYFRPLEIPNPPRTARGDVQQPDPFNHPPSPPNTPCITLSVE